MADARNTKLEKALRKVRVYALREGFFAVATYPEEVVDIREALTDFNEEGLSYGVAAYPFTYWPGGPVHYEVRGFPLFADPIGHLVAHEQSIEKGYGGIKGWAV